MADPNWSSVVTYLRFNAAGSSTVTDEVGGSRTWTLNGGAAQSATGAIKGGSSLRTVGNTGSMYVSSSDNLSDWHFGTGDFTLDVTIQCGEQGPDFFTTLAQADGAWFFRLRWFGRQVEFMGLEFDPGAGYLTDGLPHTIRLSRVSNVVYCQIDGRTDLMATSSYAYTTNLPLPTGKLIARATAGDQWYAGVMDEFRVTKGVGRSTGAYTPDAGEFETGGAATTTGTIAWTETDDVSSMSGTSIVSGELVWTEANDAMASSGTVRTAGSIVYTEANDTNAASGGTGRTGVAAWTEANDINAATGEITAADTSGTLAWVEADDANDASGTVATPATGGLSWTEEDDVASIAGTSEAAIQPAGGSGGKSHGKTYSYDYSSPKAEPVKVAKAPEPRKPAKKQKPTVSPDVVEMLSLLDSSQIATAQVLAEQIAQRAEDMRRMAEQAEEDEMIAAIVAACL